MSIERFAVPNVMNGAVAEVDVARIVQQEVSVLHGFLDANAYNEKERRGIQRMMAEYRAARFGEGEKRDGSDLPPTRECFHYWPKAGPGEKCEKCGYEWPWPTPSAPAVIGLEGGRLTSSPVYTDAERKTLKRIETFCTALARYYALLDSSWKFQREAGVPVTTPPPGTEVTSAAREYLR